MTDPDIEFALPRVVSPGVVEVGPFFDRLGSGGYFIAKAVDGRREFHWYTEYAKQGEQFLMTRDEAFDNALDAVEMTRASRERRAA
ncbi:hypothetical protein KGP96_07500 [Burkholderia multivorans]|uniref:hypothetical protein n=1 Tax=Burkholderia multivorans TaxID=87883 RepID=UPI00209DB86D|nr:hypothetical protein [Burkholderia multivorans]MCO8625164.1 hypothetical protein [Burkholderia multivorans]